MAYNVMGNFSGDYSMPQPGYGYETEEQRRRREEQERQAAMMAGLPQPGQTVGTAPAVAGPNRGLADIASAYMNKQMDPVQQMPMGRDVEPEPTPVKQTITTDPITGEQKMKIEGSVQDLTAANPLTPTVSGPAVPAAMPPPQVMPQPRVMSPQMAAPQPAMPQQAAPQPRPMPMPVPAQLPAAGPIDPNAQLPEIGQVPTPGPAIQVASAPGAALPQMAATPLRTPTVGAGAEGTTGEAQAQATIQAAQDRFLKIQDNTDELMKYATDATVPKYLQDRAREAAYEKLIVSRQEQKAQAAAQKLIAEGDSKAIANALQGRGTKGEEGSYLKMILLGFISPELAGAEAVKLGLKSSKWETGLLTDDKGNTTAVEIQRRADGKLLGGTRVDGTPLTTAELEKAAGSNKDYDIVGGTFISDTLKDKNGVPLVGSVYRSKKNPNDQFVQTSEGKKSLTGFRPQSSQGSLGDMNTRQLQELRNKLDFAGPNASAEVRERIIGESEAKFGPLSEEYKAQVRGAAPRPSAPAPAVTPPAVTTPASPAVTTPAVTTPAAAGTTPAPAPAVAAPVKPVTGSGVAVGGGTPAQREANLATQQAAAAADIQRRKEMQLTTGKPAAEQVAASADTQNILNSIEKVVKIIDSGDHNIGHAAGGLVSGQLTGERVQKIGEAFRTEDAKNTKLVMDTVQKLASEGLKVLGSNPSTVDLEFWTKYKPDIGSDPAFVKDWMQSRSEDLKRRLNYAQQQVNAGGNAPAAAPVNQAPRGSAANPIKIN